jgi:hypothetical protein
VEEVAVIGAVAFFLVGVNTTLIVVNRVSGKSRKGRVWKWLSRRIGGELVAYSTMVAWGVGGIFVSFVAAIYSRPVFEINIIVWVIPYLVVNASDYFADDDRWKRLWRAAKNKIRWRMVLPTPVRQAPGAA